MSKEVTLIVLGLFTALLPQLGFPSLWRTIFLTLLGIAVAVIGFLLRRDALSRTEPGRADFFVDNRSEEVTAVEPERPKVQ